MEDIMIEAIKIDKKYFDAVVSLEKLCFPNDYMNEKDLDNQFKDERTSFFAIIKDNDLLAQISIYNWKGENDYVKIISIGVHPDHRNKGYAHDLMQYTIKSMNDDNMYIFKAETRESNLKMQKIFSDFGFAIEYKMEDYYDNPSESAFRYLLNNENNS